MKKIISLFALAAFVLVGFSSCDYDGKDDAYVTHYVSIDLKEGDTYLVAKGSTYTDPGYTATEGTEDVTSKVTVSGDVDANKMGIYNVTYSAVNKDGFSASVTRKVLVYDPEVTTNISGTYKVTSTDGSQSLFDIGGRGFEPLPGRHCFSPGSNGYETRWCSSIGRAADL